MIVQYTHYLSPVADPGRKSGHGSPSSLSMDFDPIQQRNKREILGNVLNWPPIAECLDPWLPLAECLDPPVSQPLSSTKRNALSTT